MPHGAAIRLGCFVVVMCLAGCPREYELGFPGPNPVKVWRVQFRPDDELSIYYPDSGPHAANLPVVIFSTGWNQPRASYAGYGKQLAQWGYVAILRYSPSPGVGSVGDTMAQEAIEENSEILDWCEAQNESPESPLFGMMDVDNAGSAGHSLGAGVSLGAALVDPRIKAAVPVDAAYGAVEFDFSDLLGTVGVPIMHIGVDCGGYCSRPAGSTPLFDDTIAPTVEVMVHGAGHMDFMDTPLGLSWGGMVLCPAGAADDREVRAIAVRYMIAWFNYYLKGQGEFETYFDGELSHADERDGLVTIRSNR